ncbi:MAG: DUF4129 domain-containing protein, partial [Candidatus Obscuribacterales bacterium]|nr:DUF4129 domain-containing protein [Candidatus Obscuribacterales bacterium]
AKLASQYDYKKPPDFLVKIQEWISDLLRTILDFLKGFNVVLPQAETAMIGDLVQALLILTGITCFVLLIVFMFGRLKRLRMQANQDKRGATIVDENLDSKGWKSQADQYAGDLKWRQACRCLYLSLLHGLAEKEILSYNPTRSNYEYWYDLSSRSSLQSGFRQLADIVELVWFGNYTAFEEDYIECSRLVGEMEKAEPANLPIPSQQANHEPA